MAKIEVLGGEIPTGKWDTSYFFEDIFPEIIIGIDGEFRKLDLNTIKSAEIVDQEQIKSIASSAELCASLVYEEELSGVFTGIGVRLFVYSNSILELHSFNYFS